MSITVLRTFISKCKEEHEANLPKKAKRALKVSEDCRDNGECEDGNEIALDKPCNTAEAFSASGLRALRYAHEVEGIGHVVALDNDEAMKVIQGFCIIEKN
ncbi:hypothetical protein AHAS_Ahas17G0131700 [Arachis hypogaea]